MLIIALATSVVASALLPHKITEVQDARLLSFEESVAPFAPLKGSKISLSQEHYKHGGSSLKWQWKSNGAQISIKSPIGYLAENPDPKETSVSSFVFWVYSARPLEGNLKFEFRKEGKTCAWFDYQLSFEGWRGAWVAFERDMQGAPQEDMDELVITANGAKRGELFLDHIILSSFQDIRHHTADFQAPFINAATTNHWLVLLNSWNKELPRPSINSIDEQTKRDIISIEGRLTELLLEGKKAKPIGKLRNQYAQYGISENGDGTVKGKPIWFVRYSETYINLGHPTVNKLFNKANQTLRQYNDFMLQLGIAYRLSSDVAERRELAEMYVMMTRHLLDQGFAAGSAQGTLHHLGYSMRNFYTAPILMREVLEEAELSGKVQQAMEWFSGVGEVKSAPTTPGMDVDAFNTSLIGRLASILMLPDSPEKVVWLDCFSRWVDNGYKITEGVGYCFKSDGTVSHHCKHYPAYAVDGFSGGAVNAVWLLSRTRFAVSQESHEILRNALLEMRFYCNLRSFPLALSGRHPDGQGSLVPWHYSRLALAGTPDGTSSLDTLMAAAYLRVTDKNDAAARRFKAAGIQAESSPQGMHIYPYNASASYRQGDWLVTVAGHSRYFWAAETYNKCNHYGRYLTHGSLQLMSDGEPVSSFGSGFRQEGWDWRHIPGTTATYIPMQDMKANVLNVDTYSGYEEMLLSDQTFVGGVSGAVSGGAFAMRLHEHDKYNGSLRADKSWFFFDNRIICIGSNIENAEQGEVHTTLFQNFMNDHSEQISVNGVSCREFPSLQTSSGKAVITDNLGNAYFVSDGECVATRSHQESLHEESDAPTENDFATAYINHGGVFSKGHYEYMMVVDASEEQMALYSKQMPYKVHSASDGLHAITDLNTDTYAAALFDSSLEFKGSDCVLKANRECLVMVSGNEQGGRTLSVADPDMRFYEGPSDEWFDEQGKRIERSVYSRKWLQSPSKSALLQLTLDGVWLAGENNTSTFTLTHSLDENMRPITLLKIECREGKTYHINIVKSPTQSY